MLRADERLSADRIEIVVIEEVIEPCTPCGRVVSIPATKALTVQVDHVGLVGPCGRNVFWVEKVFARGNQVQMSSHALPIGGSTHFLKGLPEGIMFVDWPP